jgi:hypothetical protein
MRTGSTCRSRHGGSHLQSDGRASGARRIDTRRRSKWNLTVYRAEETVKTEGLQQPLEPDGTSVSRHRVVIIGSDSATSWPTTTDDDLTHSPRHVGEARKMQLVSNSHRLGRAVAMLGQNQVCLTAARVVAIEGIGSIQQDDHIRILFQ